MAVYLPNIQKIEATWNPNCVCIKMVSIRPQIKTRPIYMTNWVKQIQEMQHANKKIATTRSRMQVPSLPIAEFPIFTENVTGNTDPNTAVT